MWFFEGIILTVEFEFSQQYYHYEQVTWHSDISVRICLKYVDMTMFRTFLQTRYQCQYDLCVLSCTCFNMQWLWEDRSDGRLSVHIHRHWLLMKIFLFDWMEAMILEVRNHVSQIFCHYKMYIKGRAIDCSLITPE